MPAFETRMSMPPYSRRGLGEGARDRRFVGDVERDAADRILAVRCAKLLKRRIERLCVDVGEHDAGALAEKPRARWRGRCRRRRR